MEGGQDPPDPPGTSRSPGNSHEQQPKEREYEEISYAATDSAPYRVYFEPADKASGKLNKFALGSALKKMESFKNFITDMKYVSQRKIIVFLSSYVKANKLVEQIKKEGIGYKAYIPRHLICITGVISGIPTDIDLEEIKGDIECDVPVLSINRMFRGKEKEPINRVRITFRSQQLPETVKLFCCSAKIRPFTPSIILCGKCLRFGHKTTNCKGVKRCEICAERHEEEEQFINCQKLQKCAHCRSNEHNSLDNNCPERKRQQDIKILMSKRNWTYTEAKEQISTSYRNPYAPLLNAEEFPTPMESFAKVTRGNFARKDAMREAWIKTNEERQEIQPAVKLHKDQPKQMNKNFKRARTEDSRSKSEAKSTFEEREEIIAPVPGSGRGTALNNPQKVQVDEKWENAVRQAQLNLDRNYQERMMSFYSEFINLLGPQEEVKALFKDCTKKHFNLANSVVLNKN